MKPTRFLACATFLAGVAFASTALAQEWRTAGPVEYAKACATCHGAKGQGDGPFASVLKVRPPDLTMLKQNNGGVFPFAEIVDIIDGRKDIRAHGSNMPIWGDQFKVQSGQGDEMAAEIDAAGRVAVLAFYLASIQK
jgi:mono/diheme cytochrome c family protein